ncbi:MAG TPA: fumarylacetoacetase [Candidatus Baltobacteraceae bacterium]|jgi:fumarylacetoacetase|nr:fumarylacetoacetase [Candidatus Baltobacteraceae bacterium]
MIVPSDATNPHLESWSPVAAQSDFPIQNLPFGVFSAGGLERIGVALGDRILDLAAVAEASLADDLCERELLTAPRLNPLLAAGRSVWTPLRERLSLLLRCDGDPRLREANADRFFVARDAVTMRVPMEIGDYVDFYSSIEHATNLGRLFRPNSEALLPNWRWLPVGYHGRSGTIVIDDTTIRRPSGQRKPPDAVAPDFGASRRLDIELEMGFVSGAGNELGVPIAADDAGEHIFGLLLVNDWSARDIQAWEYQPLGPFLGKSFATTISPWIVTLDALEPFRVAGPVQEPPPLPYLTVNQPWAYAIELAVELQSESMRAKGLAPATISRTNFRNMYWNVAQQLAHATANGAVARPGDLFASGTISGNSTGTQGSFIELSWNGERPIELPDGETRRFLEDGDEVVLRGWCEREGARRIGFGVARGRIAPALDL